MNMSSESGCDDLAISSKFIKGLRASLQPKLKVLGLAYISSRGDMLVVYHKPSSYDPFVKCFRLRYVSTLLGFGSLTLLNIYE